MNQPMHNPQEYTASMQAAALGFLQRHQGEHLTDDGKLFDRAVSYLVNSLEVPAFVADRLVHLAMSELKPRTGNWIGIDHAASGDLAGVVLIDNRTGQRSYIPRRFLPERFLAQAVALP